MNFTQTTASLFQDIPVPKETTLVGYTALIQEFNIQAPLRRFCCVATNHVRGSVKAEGLWKIYDKRYQPANTFSGHLTFALKHENLDLLVLKRLFQAIPRELVDQFVAETPLGIQNRRAGFLYEFLTDLKLNVPDVGNVSTIDLLEPEHYFTVQGQISKRFRVRNNLLGTNQFCPIVRKTVLLKNFTELNLPSKAQETIGQVSQQLIARAASFMLLADSRASFEIEGERPPRSRLERWGKAVQQVGKYPLSLSEILRLQQIVIADTRFVKIGLREENVFLGERDSFLEPLPEFIGAKPEDLPNLITGLIESNTLMQGSQLDPVLQAAVIAFGFVYIHPLQDGNGRLHRCLIHHVLAERKFTPPGIVFPVSSVMQERIQDYRQTLQNHTKPLMEFIDWQPTLKGNVTVLNDTADLYRYFDGTQAAEFLYECVRHTVENSFPHELAYLQRHDEAINRMMDLVEMPNKLAEDFLLFTLQNQLTLPKSRRKNQFQDLTDQEVLLLEGLIREIFEGFKVNNR